MEKIKITHNRKNCIGCNSCIEIAPQTWTMNKTDGKSRLIGSKTKGLLEVGEIFKCDLQANKSAAKACPRQIIKIENQI